MAYDPQRSRPRQSVSEDEPAPVDAILDEIADEAEADAAERAGMADVVEALVEEIVEDEAIIDALAAQPTEIDVNIIEVTEVIQVEEEVVAVVDATPQLPDGVEIEVHDDEIIVHTPNADVEVAASGTDVIVHTDDADVDVNTSDDVVVVSTMDDEVIVDVSADARSFEADLPEPGRSGRMRSVVVAGAIVAIVAVVLWLRRHGRTED